MGKPQVIELGDGTAIRILYEDRSVLAIDKPAGWLLAPLSWDRTGRNLHAALESGVRGGEFWARSRHLKFLRFVHRLDADTSGVLLLARNPGALKALQQLFETRQVEKKYLAVVRGKPSQREWSCHVPIMPSAQPGMMAVADSAQHNPRKRGKPAETAFRVLESGRSYSLIEARPLTGRTHQIRIHLAFAGCPVVGDPLYGPADASLPRQGKLTRAQREAQPLALRAVLLAYRDPFIGRMARIEAPAQAFLARYGFLDRDHPAPPTGPTRGEDGC